MPVAEIDKVSELTERLDALRAARSTLETQRARVSESLAKLTALRPAVLKAHASGNAKAGKQLDDLDTEERAELRSIEGLDVHLAENATQIATLEDELSRETTTAATTERQRQFEAAVQRAQARAKKVRALESELVAEFTQLHADMHDLVVEHPGLDGSSVASRIYDGLNFHLERVNANWSFSQRTFGATAFLGIRPMLPPKR